VGSELFVIGLSHHGAPLELRERLAVPAEQLPNAIRELLIAAELENGVLISTCNRVEVVSSASDPKHAATRIVEHLNRRANPGTVDGFVYQRVGEDAVRHLFRVASGLDSMVLGEPQILGQVKAAFACAANAGVAGSVVSRWFSHAFSVAKRVRTETGVAAGHVSVSSIACDLAEKIFGDLNDRRVLLVGAGKMSEVAARSLAARGAKLFVVNRSPERAESLAKACGGTPRPLEALATELNEADVVISSTANPDFVITHELMLGVTKARRHRPLFIIDIAVPRDVDPRVGTLNNVFVYNMDDLKEVAQTNLSLRKREVMRAEAIVETEVALFGRRMRSLQLTPTIVALRERFRAVVIAELERTTPRLSQASEKDKQMLQAMAEAIVSKLLHGPLAELKRANEQADDAELLAVTRRLFQLENDVVSTQQQDVSESDLTPAGSRSRGPT
jgi:glutamyl-tRNA reductase